MSDRILARTLEGAIWSAAGRFAQTALSILSVAVIAQVLTPQTYGLFGAAMLLIALTEVITAGALTQSLIQRKTLDQQHIDATFWLNSLLSLVAGLALTSFATPLLALVNAPEARAALLCLAGLTVLNGVAAVPQALLMRNMNFRRSMQIDTASTALASMTGIGLAIGGAGIWALILMESMRVLVRTWLLLARTDWTISGMGSRDALRDLLAFNLSSLATVSLGRIEQLLPRMLVATLLGPQSLGIWLLARRVVDETQRLSSVPLTAVTMTAIARLQDEPARVRHVVLGLYQASSLFALPMHAGMIAILPWALPLAFGAHWSAAVLPCQILLLSGLRTCNGVFDVSILRGLGRVGLPLIALTLGIVAHAGLIPAFVDLGIAGVAGAFLLRYLLLWPLDTLFIARTTGINLGHQLLPMAAPLLAATVMALIVHAWMIQLASYLGPAITLSTGLALGAICYPAILFAISPRRVHRLLDLVKALRRRDRDRLGQLLGDTA